MKVVFDAGHGGKDPGAVGNMLQEKDINLSVSMKAGEILKRHGVEVIYTRTTDVFLELHERTSKANSLKADALVSVHCNSATNSKARGVETFYYSGSMKGAALAKSIQDELVGTNMYSANRGLKTASFHMIRASHMPAALVELAFISNVDDAKLLKDKQDEMALAIAKGVLAFLGVKYIEDKKEETNKVKIRYKNKLHEVSGYIDEGRNYVQLRETFEKLGFIVDWDNDKKEVIIK